jgi:hypothetical protein
MDRLKFMKNTAGLCLFKLNNLAEPNCLLEKFREILFSGHRSFVLR